MRPKPQSDFVNLPNADVLTLFPREQTNRNAVAGRGARAPKKAMRRAAIGSDGFPKFGARLHLARLYARWNLIVTRSFAKPVARLGSRAGRRCDRARESFVKKKDVTVMNKICTAASLVALMAIPAFAQDSTTPSPASPSAPVEDVAPAPAPARRQRLPVATPDAAIPDKTADKSAPPRRAGLGSEVAASDLLNQKVKNSASETVGDINDLSIGSDGKIAAVIIGLGGFLGMGEKNVSLPYDELNFSRDANGYLIVTVNATRDSLQAAPEWKKPARS